METPTLSAEEFRKLLSKDQLPKNFIVKENVVLEPGSIIPHHMRMANGRFTGSVQIELVHVTSPIRFLNCIFEKGLSILGSEFDMNVSFIDCTGELLEIRDCKIDSLSWEGKLFDDFFIGNSEWGKAFINNYPFARVLELARQGIYIKLSEIFPYLGK